VILADTAQIYVHHYNHFDFSPALAGLEQQQREQELSEETEREADDKRKPDVGSLHSNYNYQHFHAFPVTMDASTVHRSVALYG
jgi:hypothetical protein